MWLETINNWINELLSRPNPSVAGDLYVDKGVQTEITSLWGTVKQWFLDVCCVRSSQFTSLAYNKVEKWRNTIDSNQSVSLHDSESPLTNIGF